MKICAIDSSGLVASVAIIEDGITIAEYSINHKITHSQTLLPMLDEVCKMVELDKTSIDAFAVAAGPGSFTGLRIGAATVKGLGVVFDKPVVAVPTLEGLAFNAYGSGDLICPIMDARRSQVYTGIYAFEFDEDRSEYCLKAEMKQTACAFTELCEKLNSFGKRVMFIGDGIPVFEESMKEQLNVPYIIAPANMNRQRAASVAALAESYLNSDCSELEGAITSADDFAPDYLRMSQAERERKEKESGT